MTVRKLSPREVLQDIRSGMDESAIRRKYSLSVKGLKNLYDKLIEAGFLGPNLEPVRRRLDIGAILADIRDGMSDSDLMKKFDLSAEMLRRASKKLLEVRAKKPAEDGLATLIEDPPGFLATREFVRHEVDFEIRVYETSRPEVDGLVRDISEEGVGVVGIDANLGDVKTLVILGDEFGEFSSFEFEGYCRWCFADEAQGTSVTGFAISKISEKDMQELRKLVRLIAVGG